MTGPGGPDEWASIACFIPNLEFRKDKVDREGDAIVGLVVFT